MATITKPMTIEELKQIFFEELFNKTTKVTKTADNSVLNGVGYGVAKIGQKAMKDISLVESHLLPEGAFGTNLDIVADRLGIAPRFEASGSSTFVRVVGDVGTIYLQGTHVFSSSSGIDFDLEKDVTIGVDGFNYAKIRSQDVGDKTNVEALSINTVAPVPTGHQFVINEYRAIGGRDIEQDDIFLRRIKEGPNILGKSTLAFLTQVFNKINSDVLRVFYNGSDGDGKNVLNIATQNGIDLTQAELDELLDKGKDFFPITDLKPFEEDFVGIKLQNVTYFPIDISIRVKLDTSFNPDDIRRNIQVRIAKNVDFRFFTSDQKVEFEDLISIVRNTRGILSIGEQFVFPATDVEIPKSQLPRLRSFLLLDLEGSIITDTVGELDPIFYSAEPDSSFQRTVLSQLEI